MAVVGVSGGVDSLVLLHLLRFTPGLPSFDLHPAHFDHRMRPDSAADARWVRGFLRSWGFDGIYGRADGPVASEAAARRARYEFLEEARREVGARWVLMGHHADDQAETVLFRALRGTGIRGLAGIPERREPGILRPLLPFHRRELEAYAGAVAIRPRPDPTNVDPRFARSVLRHELLPRAEETFAPGAREALVRLGRIARVEEDAWESLYPRLLHGVLVGVARGGDERRFILDRPGFLAYHRGVRARLLRTLLRRLGVDLDEAGTRDAVEFTSSGASGRRLELPDRVVLRREFDRFVLGRIGQPGPDAALRIEGPGSGSGEFAVGGREMIARWAMGSEPSGTWIERFSPSRLHFPLRLRGWEAGDRIRFSLGSKKLKQVFGERKVPVRRRGRWPVLADARGEILWVPGLVRSQEAAPDAEEAPFMIGIADADSL